MSNTKKQDKIEKATQEVNLVEGLFRPSEADFLINVLIEEKINFHKLQRLSLCIGQEKADTKYENSRIDELLREKQIAKDYISVARKEGYNVVINGKLNISFVK
ncbi:hypothetical protein [Winogradskyella poriferorum]|uniref:Uncharacterized protein n=1 Tax=Winogradskyella poriferorum TaxID=307627 RepID=A0ABU7W5K0_9FLAO|tara:strand:+ start:5951 stop:6262 length:312 start_codon:yes stop_codon:yes gene_type:complete